MEKNHDDYEVVPFPKMRRFALDAGHMGRRKHIIHALVEVDVTKARQCIREHKTRTGESLSFTAFIITCLAKAVEMNRYVQAYRNWRGHLVLFDKVNVNTMIEVESEGQKIPIFGHDIVDGAPAARFTHRLKELIESGYGFSD